MKTIYFLLFAILLTSCSIQKSHSSTRKTTTNSSSTSSNNSYSGKTKSVLQEAKTFIGTPYKFGGTTAKGMDCSGLVVKSFSAANVNLPRVSRDQANQGEVISKSKAKAGDLVFFNTSGRGISHVGIIERVENGEIFFIHASSSRGVMISSLNNSYWKPKVVKFTRVL